MKRLTWYVLCKAHRRVLAVLHDLTRRQALRAARLVARSRPRGQRHVILTDQAPRGGNPLATRGKSRAKYQHRRLKAPGKLDQRSLRTVRSGAARVIVGCPKGKYEPRKKRCKVGTRAKAVLKLKRKRNPAPPAELGAAVRTFRMFHGFAPRHLTPVHGRSELPHALVELGELVEVTYRSNKFDRRPRDYVHRFGTPRPKLCTGPRARGLHVVGGRYRLTARGIVG